MSHPSTQPRWLIDQQRRLWYYYDASADQLVYQNGERWPRPSQVPRTTYLGLAPPAAPTTAHHFATTYQDSSNFVTSGPPQDQQTAFQADTTTSPGQGRDPSAPIAIPQRRTHGLDGAVHTPASPPAQGGALGRQGQLSYDSGPVTSSTSAQHVVFQPGSSATQAQPSGGQATGSVYGSPPATAHNSTRPRATHLPLMASSPPDPSRQGPQAALTQTRSPSLNPHSLVHRPIVRDFQRPQVGVDHQYPDRNISEPPAGTQRAPQPSGSAAATAVSHTSESFENGIRVQSALNYETGVITRFSTEPKAQITDPAFYARNIQAHKALLGSAGNEERLYSAFKIREHPARFFVPGRVFLILWAEPAGQNATLITAELPSDRRPDGHQTTADPGMTSGRFGEPVFSKVRRFVVIRAGNLYCSALPVMTYGQQGVGKRGVIKSEHAIIFSGPTPPDALQAEAPTTLEGGRGMQPRAIRIVPDAPTDKLDPLSRVDFGKVHTVHHNVKVKALGVVHPAYQEALISQFQLVWHLTSSNSASVLRPATAAPLQTAIGSTSQAPAPRSRADSRLITQRSEDDGPGAESSSASKTGIDSVAHGGKSSQSTASRSQPSASAAERFRTFIAQQEGQGRTRKQAGEALVQRLMERHRYTAQTAAELIRMELTRDQQVQARTDASRQPPAAVTAAGQTTAEEGSSDEAEGSDGSGNEEGESEEEEDSDEDEDAGDDSAEHDELYE